MVRFAKLFVFFICASAAGAVFIYIFTAPVLFDRNSLISTPEDTTPSGIIFRFKFFTVVYTEKHVSLYLL